MRTPLLKKSLAVVLGVGMALVAAGCGSSSTTTTTTLKPSVGTLKVALVEPSATNDLAFSESMYNALESLAAPDHLKIAVSENEYVVSDAAAIIREYATRATT